jgi:cystathionine gamma-synthase
MTDKPVRRAGLPPLVGRPLVPPLMPSVVYVSDDPDALDRQYGQGAGYTYAREGHPNADSLADKINAMEGAPGGLITGSGMAAVGAVFLACLKAGDHVLGGDQLYGRTRRLMAEDLPRQGIATSLADPTDLGAMRAALRPQTRMIIVETMSNPTLRVPDLAGLAALARGAGALLVIDNTFTTPRLCQPMTVGADIVIHSVTKLLSGHSDATLGWVGARDPGLLQAIRTAVVTWGMTPSPFDCWLADRGLLSFDLRLAQAQRSAAAIADALAGHPGIDRVFYPGRADHPDHGAAMAQFGGQGGNMVSLSLGGGRAAANAFARAAEGLAFAPTLGDVTTTLSHPASSSHRALTVAARAALGIGEGFFRISVGIEQPEVLVTALLAAADAAVRAG